MKRIVSALLLTALALPMSAAQAAAPINDDMANATALAVATQSVAGDTTDATTEAGEVESACGALENTVWYSLPATTAGLSISLSNASLGFAVYSDDAGSLLETACAAPGGSAKFVMNKSATEPGKPHLIQVGGPTSEGAPTGAFDLNIHHHDVPVNDGKGAAIVIPASAATYTVDTYMAGLEPGEPKPSCNTDAQNTVWYRLNAPAAQTISFSTEGSDIDTVLAVYRVTGPTKQDPVGCNDNLDRDLGLFSHTAVTLKGGEDYLVQIGTRGAGTNLSNIRGGDVVLTVIPNGNDTRASAAWTDGLGAFEGSTVGATADASESDLPCATDGGPSVWYQFLPVQRAETFAIISPDAEIAVYHPSGALIGCSMGSGGVTIPSANSLVNGAWLFNQVMVRMSTTTAQAFSFEIIHGAYAHADAGEASATIRVDSDSRSAAGTQVCVAGNCQTP
jgi:hypothetical protein